MKKTILTFALLTMLFTACEEKKAADTTTETATVAEGKPDMAAIKAEIQTLENAWGAADNARDAATLAAFYADDAISMSNNKPMAVGKVAIQKDLEASLAKKPKGFTLAFEIMNVYGDENQVTEIGKSIGKDASGKVVYTGKYMAVWEKRDGKYVCLTDISNDDVKEK